VKQSRIVGRIEGQLPLQFAVQVGRRCLFSRGLVVLSRRRVGQLLAEGHVSRLGQHGHLPVGGQVADGGPHLLLHPGAEGCVRRRNSEAKAWRRGGYVFNAFALGHALSLALQRIVLAGDGGPRSGQRRLPDVLPL